ncbi:hypothetical protein E8L99_20315 [Phreatobacter aquaticus]|uniref:Uncharacterized protein n=1 Tax=Phreatobacter aquaticus TaxID=2570229 RepID=A0A4D7QR01_9HYPH|nr:hypothetical protein [Phreatobacter aquaticus]QCK87929.1 hypothetical protein E8L99_20315 [Phreatobacter aquaticus]
MLIARAVAIACLSVFAWLLWALTLLLLLYLFMAWRASDPTFKLVYLGIGALSTMVAGFVSRHVARRIERS